MRESQSAPDPARSCHRSGAGSSWFPGERCRGAIRWRDYHGTRRAPAEALDRRAAGLAVHGAVVLDLRPRLGRFVQEVERQLGHAVEHPQEPPLKCAPERLLLAILIRAVGKRAFLDHAQAQQTLGDFLGHHRGAVIGQQRTGQAPFLDRLGEPVHEVLGSLREIPLHVAAESRMVVKDAQRDAALPLAALCQHLERSVMEIEMPRRPDMGGLIAADLPRLASAFGACFTGALVGPRLRPAQPSRAPACRP